MLSFQGQLLAKRFVVSLLFGLIAQFYCHTVL